MEKECDDQCSTVLKILALKRAAARISRSTKGDKSGIVFATTNNLQSAATDLLSTLEVLQRAKNAIEDLGKVYRTSSLTDLLRTILVTVNAISPELNSFNIAAMQADAQIAERRASEANELRIEAKRMAIIAKAFENFVQRLSEANVEAKAVHK